MPREEHDREDLLAEAGALVERVELEIAGRADSVVAGFRRDASASFYLSAERVYQFTAAGELRRAFVDGLIYKAERRQLVSLRRERHDDRVDLVRHELPAAEAAAFLDTMRSHLAELRTALAENRVKVLRQVSEQGEVVSRVRRWLEEFADGTPVARSPRAE